MAKSGFVILLFLVSLLATTSTAYEVIGGATAGQINNIKIADITQTLYRKGYGAMAVLLPKILEPYFLQPPHPCNPLIVGKLTIFAPTDYAFSDHLYAFYTRSELLLHQIVPFLHLPKAAFCKQLKAGDTVDTLLPSTPLMYTPYGFSHVPVKEYGIYDDGQVIVHGVHHFFDPVDQSYAHHTDWTSASGYSYCSRRRDEIPEALSPMTFITGSESPKPNEGGE